VDCVITQSRAAFRILSEGKTVWIPKSILEELNVRALDEAHANRGPLCCVQIPKWFADKVGLEGV
jgi:hypothetical protein